MKGLALQAFGDGFGISSRGRDPGDGRCTGCTEIHGSVSSPIGYRLRLAQCPAVATSKWYGSYRAWKWSERYLGSVGRERKGDGTFGSAYWRRL